jgi:hypothetical protein
MSTRRSFIEQQILGLSPLDSVAFIVNLGDGVAWVEVLRDENGERYTSQVGGQPDLAAAVIGALPALGFELSEATRPTCVASSVDAVVKATESVLSGPFGAGPDAALDVRHASRRIEVELQRKLTALRARVRIVLADMMPEGVDVDSDDDFTFAFESTRVWVAPRLLPSGLLIVRVMAVTNVGVDPTPTLGLFLAETNFALALGRFSLDARQHAVWFEHTLLGEYFTDEELRIVVAVVASTADRFDDRIAELFGGRVFNLPGKAAEPEERPADKPGTDGYL